VSLEDLSTERDPLSTLCHNAQVLAACGAPDWQKGNTMNVEDASATAGHVR
jgi:hypothetical protein